MRCQYLQRALLFRLMELKSLVASRIREARRRKNLTQQQAADLYGIAQTTWANWETGKVNVPLDTIDRISEVLELPVAFFVLANYTVNAVVPEEMIKKARRQRGPAKTPAQK